MANSTADKYPGFWRESGATRNGHTGGRPASVRFPWGQYIGIAIAEGRKFGFFFVMEKRKTVVGAVEMWKSRRWRFPRLGADGGKLDVELGRPITRDESFPPSAPSRHFHSASVSVSPGRVVALGKLANPNRNPSNKMTFFRTENPLTKGGESSSGVPSRPDPLVAHVA